MTDVFEVCACSIIDCGTECVVNASNESARLGGGVSRALAEECGPALQEEMTAGLDDLGGRLEEGECLVTSAGASKKFRYVLHVPAVDYSGARAQHGGTVTSARRLSSCAEAAVRAAIDIAGRDGHPTSVTFPLLGAGSGGMPVELSFRAMMAGIQTALTKAPDGLVERIVFAVPEPDRFATCERLLLGGIGQ